MLPIIGGAVVILASLAAIANAAKSKLSEPSQHQPLFAPYVSPHFTEPRRPSALDEFTVADGVEWVNQRHETLKAEGVKPLRMPPFLDPAFQKRYLPRYEMDVLSTFARSRHTCPKALYELIGFYVEGLKMKKELRPLFPLVDSVTKKHLEARRQMLYYYSGLEAQYLQSSISVQELRQMAQAVGKVDRILDILKTPAEQRLYLRELLLTPLGVANLRQYFLAEVDKVVPRDMRGPIVVEGVLLPILLELNRDGENANLGHREVSPADRALRGVPLSAPSRRLKPYLEALEQAVTSAGVSIESLQAEQSLQQCRRCGLYFPQLKTGTCCWGCWGN